MFVEGLTLDTIVCDIYIVKEIQCCLGNDWFWDLEFIAAMGMASLREKHKCWRLITVKQKFGYSKIVVQQQWGILIIVEQNGFEINS